MSKNIDNKDKKLKENSKDVVEEKASEKIEAEKKDEVKKEEPKKEESKKEEPAKEDLNDSEVIDLNKVEEKQKQEVKKPEVKKSSTDFIMSKKRQLCIGSLQTVCKRICMLCARLYRYSCGFIKNPDITVASPKCKRL